MARDTKNVVNRRSVGGRMPHTRREAGDSRQTERGSKIEQGSRGMGMDMGMGGAFGGAMHDAAAMGGGALGEMGNDAAMMGGLQDAASSYAGPTGMPNGTMGTNPMDGAKVMEGMGELRKKKKNPMDMGGMDYAGPMSGMGSLSNLDELGGM